MMMMMMMKNPQLEVQIIPVRKIMQLKVLLFFVYPVDEANICHFRIEASTTRDCRRKTELNSQKQIKFVNSYSDWRYSPSFH